MGDGCQSKLVTLYEECSRAVFLARYCSSCTLRSFSLLENKLIGYADDATLMAVVPSPGVRVAVAESLSLTLAGLVSGVTFGA